MHYSGLPDLDLLQRLVGVREARRLYRGSLQPFFAPSHEAGTANEKCAVARELVKRWIGEELKRDCVLSQPAAVRDYLRIHFGNQEHESFVTLYLDSQNRLIRSEELFRGTLTQTSVYPREIVKGALRANAAAVIFAHFVARHKMDNYVPRLVLLPRRVGH